MVTGACIELTVTAPTLEPCPNCGSDKALELFSATDADSGSERFTIVRCSGCALVRTAPWPAGQDLAAYYRSGYYGGGEKKFARPLESVVQAFNRRRARRLLRMIGEPVRGTPPSVLDIGCGRGGLLKALVHLGCDCHGLERADFDPPADHGGIHYHLGAIGAQGFDDGSFDLVIVWHVLEHLPAPFETLHAAVKLMRSGGVLALAVPNFGSRQSRWFGADWFHLDLPRHLWHFSDDNLNDACRELDLTLVKKSTVSLDQNVYGFIQSTLNRLFNGPPNRLYRALQGGRERPSVQLAGQVATGLLLAPLALLEALIPPATAGGATLVQYWRKS